MSITEYLDEAFYPNFSSNWDDAIFRDEILSVVKENDHLLDMGAGAGIVSYMNFKGLVDHVTGIDLDPRVTENPFLDVGVVGNVTATPFLDKQFDIIICDNVLEHVEDPEGFFREVSRLLKPGGHFLGKTPNKNHYMPVIARYTPYWFHRFYNGLRGRSSEDTFPTHYKINCSKDAHKYARSNGLTVVDLKLVDGRPEYLRIFFPLYLFGILYERLVSGVKALNRFSVLMIVVLQKNKFP